MKKKCPTRPKVECAPEKRWQLRRRTLIFPNNQKRMNIKQLKYPEGYLATFFKAEISTAEKAKNKELSELQRRK